MRTFPPCSTTWPSMTPYGTPPSFSERVLNSTDKLAEFPGCTRPRQSTARACAGSVWPGSMCSTRWTTRNKSFASWPLSASGRTRAGSRASHDAPPAAPLPVLQRGEQSRRSDDRQRGPKLGPSLPWPRRCSIVRSRRSSSAFLASRSLSRAWACPFPCLGPFPGLCGPFFGPGSGLGGVLGLLDCCPVARGLLCDQGRVQLAPVCRLPGQKLPLCVVVVNRLLPLLFPLFF